MKYTIDELTEALSRETRDELLQNILPYWIDKMPDQENEGFYGRIDGFNNLHKDAAKGIILNTRILWTFSAACRLFRRDEYLATAHQALAYIIKYFVDQEYGGVYWMLDHKGNPIESKKQIYGQAFAIYALAEYYRVTRDQKALDLAKSIFRLLEKHSFDEQNGGYIEALDRKWQPLADLRLSEKDANEKKSMNTHLHVLEAYTNLYRIWPDTELKQKLEALIHVFLKHIIDPISSHFCLFFDEKWNKRSKAVSYGHDIEGSWLLIEAAEMLNDPRLIEKVKSKAMLMAATVVGEGIDDDGGLWYELHKDGVMDFDKHWWPQAEAIVGFVSAWQQGGGEHFMRLAYRVWKFTKTNIIDSQNGEWYFRVNRDGKPYLDEDKAGPWKCPYHNGRMCMEIYERLKVSP
ncbi:MAG: AGE family epimerase/isomerase [Cyclobacteriaceae bacterium]